MYTNNSIQNVTLISSFSQWHYLWWPGFNLPLNTTISIIIYMYCLSFVIIASILALVIFHTIAIYKDDKQLPKGTLAGWPSCPWVHLVHKAPVQVRIAPNQISWTSIFMCAQRLRKLWKPCRTFGPALLEYSRSEWKSAGPKKSVLFVFNTLYISLARHLKGQQKCPGHSVRHPDKSAWPALSMSGRSGRSDYLGTSVCHSCTHTAIPNGKVKRNSAETLVKFQHIHVMYTFS